MKWNAKKVIKANIKLVLKSVVAKEKKCILCIKWSSLEIKIQQFEVVHACSWWKIAWHNLTFYDFFSWLFFCNITTKVGSDKKYEVWRNSVN